MSPGILVAMPLGWGKEGKNRIYFEGVIVNELRVKRCIIKMGKKCEIDYSGSMKRR